MVALPETLAAFADTAHHPGATVRPTLDARARALSPFTTSRRTLPPLSVHFPGGSTPPDEAHHDLVVKRVLAEGGMGRVYLADQRTLAREVAIKTVKDAADPGQAEALVWEGAITGHLDHPGVTRPTST